MFQQQARRIGLLNELESARLNDHDSGVNGGVHLGLYGFASLTFGVLLVLAPICGVLAPGLCLLI
jgi:hypothetical protein